MTILHQRKLFTSKDFTIKQSGLHVRSKTISTLFEVEIPFEEINLKKVIIRKKSEIFLLVLSAFFAIIFIVNLIMKVFGDPEVNWQTILILFIITSLCGIITLFVRVHSYYIPTTNNGLLEIYFGKPTLADTNKFLDDLKQSLAQSNMDNTAFRNQVETEIGTLGTKIDNLGSRDLSVLGEATLTPSPTASPEASLGQITVKDANLTTVNVYQDSATDSAVVGTVQFGVTYPFYQKITDWYKISQGWVESRWFSENP